MAICCPQIYEDRQDGFMMQFASAGQWGRGLYFAEEAGYSDIYASKAKHMQPDVRDTKGLAMDESEFMLASLLVGSVVELDRDLDGAMQKACNALKTPPAVDGCNTRPLADGEPACTRPPQQAKGRKYNTVRGYTQTDRRRTDGTWTKDSTCPRSKVWIVYENGRACELTRILSLLSAAR